jgi:hypothetical protein
MFKIGVRNIPRRRAQTTLIVLGRCQHPDHLRRLRPATPSTAASPARCDAGFHRRIVQPQSLSDSSSRTKTPKPWSRPRLRTSHWALIGTLQANRLIDAVVPVYSDIALAVNPDKRLSTPSFTLEGVDPAMATCPTSRTSSPVRACAFRTWALGSCTSTRVRRRS